MTFSQLMTVLAVVMGPLGVIAGAWLNHRFRMQAAEVERREAQRKARYTETQAVIRDFLRAHSNGIATFRKLALLVEAQAHTGEAREEALRWLDRARELQIEMDIGMAQLEWVAPDRIVVAARKARDGTKPAFDAFNKVGSVSHPAQEELNAADAAWDSARREFMIACRLEFYGDTSPG